MDEVFLVCESFVAGLMDTPTPSTTPPPQGQMAETMPLTRTVAIIKHHALQHRFDIEPRIQEASFEIVKERQMEFDVETDPDALSDLFGEDADSLGEGPVWVYVLERRRAVEVWNTLMGHRDPEVARQETPNSLRSLFGLSRLQNAVMGSPDTRTAEMQISALFASSPPFRSTELPSESEGELSDQYGSVRSLSSSVLKELQAENSFEYGEQHSGYAASNVTNGSTVNGSNRSNGKTFKARPLPATTNQPDIVPRMSRAASLRLGMTVEQSPNRPRSTPTKEQQVKTFMDVPGHKRSSTISVASTAPPAIAPRMTKAASLRMGTEVGSPALKQRSTTVGGTPDRPKASTSFEGVPGHKRRETISVASVKPPTVTPRTNRSAALRLQKDKDAQTPPTSFRAAPTLSRKASTDSTTARRQSLAIQRSISQPPAIAPRRSLSTIPPIKPKSQSQVITSVVAVASPSESITNDSNGVINGTEAGTSASASRPPSSVAKAKPRRSSVSSPPSIAPRTNRSAALRAAKMEAEAAAAAKKAGTAKPNKTKAPPSSFKATLAI